MRWFERQRMEWLANRKAPFNRADLMKAFDISVPQASNDINKFIDNNPNRLTYNTRKKRYEVNQ